MKKLNILFLSVVALGTTVTSCSKNDSPASVIGKWQFNTMEGDIGTQNIPAGTKETVWSDSGCTTGAYWQFDSGTALHYGFYDSSNDCQVTTLDGTYTFDSKNITITSPNGSSQVCPIVKLTGTELTWKEQGSGNDADGNTVTYNVLHHMIKK